MRHLEAVREDLGRRAGLWAGLCRRAVRDHLSHDRCALSRCRAHLCGRGIVSGSARRLVVHRGLVVDFVSGCGARCLCCCRGRGRLVVRAGCRVRGDDRVISRCLTLCGIVLNVECLGTSSYSGGDARTDASKDTTCGKSSEVWITEPRV